MTIGSGVEIYTKAFCPYCHRAKALFEQKGVNFTEYDITMGGPKRAEMLERAPGRTTVPQIFIGGVHVGGCDDVMALNDAGRLDAMLAAA
ncbi:MAG: glutaredoxin 3 [Sphingopyxis sp.]|jgi:glutaredoxin 3|nr:glutaredoxin 3 [Sphingopyxis sp.]